MSGFKDVARRRRVERAIFGLLIEELGGDAGVLVYSVTVKNKTQSRCVTFGNAFATKGLVEWISDQMLQFDDGEYEEIDEELDTDSDDETTGE